MKNIFLILSLLLGSMPSFADVKISQLPLEAASSTGVNDSLPFVNAAAGTTERLTLWDLINIPTMVSTYAPLASPTFTGVVTAPTFVGAVTGTASGNTTITPNNHGVVLSGTASTLQVITPNASTAFPLVSGGASANPTWSLLGIAGGGTNSATASGAFNNLSPMTTLGDLIYGGASGAGTRLAGDTSNTRKFLRELSVTSAATAPVWDTLVSGDIPNNAANTSGTATTATNAVNIGTVSASSNASFFPIFAASSTNGNQVPNLGTGLSFNPSTNSLSTTTFVGALTGTASIATNIAGGLGGQIHYQSAVNTTALLPNGSANQTLQSSGTTLAPTWNLLTNSNLSGSAAITNANLASMNTLTIKGNNAGGSSTPLDLTVSQVNTMLGSLSNPMTTVGDVIYGGTSGVATRLAAGTFGQSLSSNGPAAAPIWRNNLAPNFETLTSGSGATYGLSYWFVTSSANCTAGATYTNSTFTFTCARTFASSTTILMQGGTGTPATSGTLTKSGGTGDSTITFTAFVAPTRLHIRIIGGGGGGSGGGTGGGTGGTGGTTIWGSSTTLMSCAGGISGGQGPVASSLVGGVCSALGSAIIGSIFQGAGAMGTVAATAGAQGGLGGVSPWGGNGTGGWSSTGTGGNGIANTGSGAGGGGAGSGAFFAGCGGSSGGFADGWLLNPSSIAATFTYTIGAGGTNGAAGTSGAAGGTGATGRIDTESDFN